MWYIDTTAPTINIRIQWIAFGTFRRRSSYLSMGGVERGRCRVDGFGGYAVVVVVVVVGCFRANVNIC